MGFTTPAFILKNTPELRKKLKELGYEILNFGNTTLDAHNYDGNGSHKSIEEGRAIITSYGNLYGVIYDIDTVTKKGRIDCGTNEGLFLAIAALRDDTDKNQWFVLDYDNIWEAVGCYQHKGDFILCNHDRWYCGTDVPHAHKATVNELIEHFKDEKEQLCVE
ncbi:hypothetical protein [Bacteroides uniformis]|uniref:hypothetical protein n=1 Tax=Bacteroides uniformis TaxID=820 RepID=UPI001105C2CF|nr:hypothetical protein [Bacteroides uniformis]MDC1864207.1 hypothetical protein [Bacteroides uniformis]MDC1867249.1 hypothetical protein [Bacteroides uniformis]